MLEFHNDWDNVLKEEIKKDYFINLLNTVNELYNTKTIYPPKKDVFNAFRLSYNDIKVVILGQDPYHGEGEAHGFAFSCLKTPIPPSLKNIYKELKTDLNIEKDILDGNLLPWVKQGVMLLNTGLTVERNVAHSIGTYHRTAHIWILRPDEDKATDRRSAGLLIRLHVWPPWRFRRLLQQNQGAVLLY